jgi:restriction system protein
MYGEMRPINAQMVMHLYGAAAYQDCSEMMIATNGRVLDDARQVAAKLGVEIRHVPAPALGVIPRR